MSKLLLTFSHSLPTYFFTHNLCSCTGQSLTATVMQFWLLRRKKLIHDYSLVGYLLSPNPTIMEHAHLNKNQGHNTAVEHLITKLILDQSLVGNERKAHKSELIDKFFDEHNDFVNKRNAFG
jgi:hypothetical protein